MTIEQDPTSSPPFIAICTANEGLQMDLLKTLISNEFEIECISAANLADLPGVPKLLIVDCDGRDMSALKDIAHTFDETAEDTPATLLNATYDSDHESLLEWPCMSGIFYTDTNPSQLSKGLKCLLNNDFWVPRRLLHNLINKTRRAPHKISVKKTGITKREKQILRQIKLGATNAAIAVELSVTEHTIKSHLYNLYKKIGVSNRVEANNWVQNVQDEELN